MLNHVRLLVTPWTVTRQAPLSRGFPSLEYWSGLSFPPGDLPGPGIEPRSPALQEDSLPWSHHGSPPRAKGGWNSLIPLVCDTFFSRQTQETQQLHVLTMKFPRLGSLFTTSTSSRMATFNVQKSGPGTWGTSPARGDRVPLLHSVSFPIDGIANNCPVKTAGRVPAAPPWVLTCSLAHPPCSEINLARPPEYLSSANPSSGISRQMGTHRHVKL